MDLSPGSAHTGPPASGGGLLSRLSGARLPVFAAAVALFGAGHLWSVPFGYSLIAFAAVLLVAVSPRHRRRAAAQQTSAPDTSNWPDRSMKAILNAMSRPVFLLDAEGNVRFVNGGGEASSPATRVGDPLTLTFRVPELREALEAAAGGTSRVVEYRERSETGRVYAMQIEPFRSHEGAPRFILVVLDDATDRLAVARMRADFVANASHELRTPLASLTGFIETLQGPARNDPDATARFLAVMLEQAERMRRLIDDLLSLSRAEMHAHHAPTDIVDIVAVVRHVSDILTPLAESLSVAVVLNAPEKPLRVRGDRDELIQIFENLIENGLKYGGGGGRLVIDVGEQAGSVGGMARVAVRDFGPGIAPDDLPRLTERFYRVDVATSREKKGTGLGLAIVKHILVRHRGELFVESKLGQGACFTVAIPTERAATP